MGRPLIPTLELESFLVSKLIILETEAPVLLLLSVALEEVVGQESLDATLVDQVEVERVVQASSRMILKTILS
jgi:hypothetical protein